MPDWNKLVREHLEPYESPACHEKVIAELAAHLEETYEAGRSQGLTEAAALELTMQEVDDWQVLAADIRRFTSQEESLQEETMNHRTKSLWLPTVLTLLGASASLMATQLLGLQPRLVWIHGMGLTLYWPWLAGLPLCGALGAHLSQRAQGPLRARLTAGLSPALIMLIVMLSILPWGLAIDGRHFLTVIGFGLGLANWVALPGVALLLGAGPFLGESSASGMRSGAQPRNSQ